MATESIDERAAKLVSKNPGNIPDENDQKTADGGGDMRPNAEPFDPDKVAKKSMAIMGDDPIWKSRMKKTADNDDDDKLQKTDDDDEDDSEGDSDPDEKEDESDDDDEDDENVEKSFKSTITKKSLMKSLDALESVALTGGDCDRREQLAKSFAAGTLTDEEREEFVELLGVEEVETEDTDTLEKGSFSEKFANDPQLSQDYEISPFIERQSQLMAEALDSVGVQLQKSQAKQGSFNTALAKSMQAIGRVIMQQHDLIKSQTSELGKMAERITQLENQPMPQKGVSGRYRPLQKSFGNDQPLNVDPNGLTRQQIDRGFDVLLQKSMTGNGMPIAPCGEILSHASAKFETQGKISKALAHDIINALNLG